MIPTAKNFLQSPHGYSFTEEDYEVTFFDSPWDVIHLHELDWTGRGWSPVGSDLDSIPKEGRTSWLENLTIEDMKSGLLGDLPQYNIEILESLTLDTPTSFTSRKRRKRTINPDWGHEVNTERFLQRDTDVWENLEPTKRPHKIIKMIFNSSTNCKTSQEQFQSKASVFTYVANLLIQTGHSVQIDVGWSSKNYTKSYDFKNKLIGITKVKDSLTPLDLSSLCFTLCSIGFNRLGLTASLRFFPEILHGWGKPNSIPKDIINSYDIVMNFKNTPSQEELKDWLGKQLDKISREKFVTNTLQ